jgi:hypothetical protein
VILDVVTVEDRTLVFGLQSRNMCRLVQLMWSKEMIQWNEKRRWAGIKLEGGGLSRLLG